LCADGRRRESRGTGNPDGNENGSNAIDHERTYWTVTVDVPLLPSDVAVIVTDPGVAPVGRETSPELLTVARLLLLELQATVRPVRTFPPASFSVAVSCTVGCVTEIVAVGGVTSTVFTGASATETNDAPETAPNPALTFTFPTARPVTSPFASTVAVVVEADDHVNGTPGTTVFVASRAEAASCRV
jgi:hypothetical protein